MKAYHAESARAGLEAAARAGLSWEEFGLAAIELLQQAIPYDGICLGPADPATSLLTGRVKLGLRGANEVAFVQHEYGAPDINRFAELARRDVGVSILDEATDGRPELSARHREIVATTGLRHEMRGTMRSDRQMWGFYTLYRETGRTGFSPAEASFLHRLEPVLTRGMRRGLIATGIEQRGAGAAVVIVDATDRIISATPAAEEWMAGLGGELWSRLPISVAIVVSAARSVPGLELRVPTMRLRSRSGQWLTVHAAPVRGPEGMTADIAVTIEPAGPAAVIPLVVAAYGLTEREQDVVQQVLAGASTNEIAARLHISPYTVQDHLKLVFEKVGVSSRRELASRIFFDHYVGRLGQGVGADGWFSEG